MLTELTNQEEEQLVRADVRNFPTSNKQTMQLASLVPKPLPSFSSLTAWKKWERAWNNNYLSHV